MAIEIKVTPAPSFLVRVLNTRRCDVIDGLLLVNAVAWTRHTSVISALFWFICFYLVRFLSPHRSCGGLCVSCCPPPPPASFSPCSPLVSLALDTSAWRAVSPRILKRRGTAGCFTKKTAAGQREGGRESWKTWLEVRAPRTHGRSCTISAPKGVQKAEKPHCSFNSAIKQRLQVDIICSISVHFLPDCSFISLKKERDQRKANLNKLGFRGGKTS